VNVLSFKKSHQHSSGPSLGSEMSTTIDADNIGADDKEAAGRNPYTLLLIVLAGMVVLGALAAFLSPKQNEIPGELRGVWKTAEAAHSDRFLELSLVSVSFGTGNGTVSTGFIRKVEIVPKGPLTLYTITYRDEEGDQELSFSYDPTDASLRLKNQDRTVWRKSHDS
jgi:hypothetical protein